MKEGAKTKEKCQVEKLQVPAMMIVHKKIARWSLFQRDPPILIQMEAAPNLKTESILAISHTVVLVHIARLPRPMGDAKIVIVMIKRAWYIQKRAYVDMFKKQCNKTS
jgi:hypothetical protein